MSDERKLHFQIDGQIEQSMVLAADDGLTVIEQGDRFLIRVFGANPSRMRAGIANVLAFREDLPSLQPEGDAGLGEETLCSQGNPSDEAGPVPSASERAEQTNCTCHPDDRPPGACQQKFAASQCQDAWAEAEYVQGYTLGKSGAALDVFNYSTSFESGYDQGRIDGGYAPPLDPEPVYAAEQEGDFDRGVEDGLAGRGDTGPHSEAYIDGWKLGDTGRIMNEIEEGDVLKRGASARSEDEGTKTTRPSEAVLEQQLKSPTGEETLSAPYAPKHELEPT